jgi:RNA polymerase sigma-70 factor (ECF subfamily)
MNENDCPHPVDLPEEAVDLLKTRASIFDRLRTTLPRERELAWTEFRTLYGPIIGGFAKRCGASRQDIDDIIQDVMTSFFSVSDDFAYDPARGRFRGWLKTCTVRTSLRRAGKNLKFRGVAFDQVPQIELAVEPVWADVWEQQLVARALEALRRSSGNNLAFRAFEKYVLLDRAVDEVARDLGTTVDNVHQAKSRYTRRLREVVAKLREAEG